MSPPQPALRAADRPLLGIALMLAFCVLAPVGDALVKLLGARMAVGQIVAVRFAVQALLLVPLAVALGLGLRVGPRMLRLLAVRTLLHIAGTAFMILALRALPLADAVAIAFVMPFLVLLLGNLVLGEAVGPRRLAACAAGFLGTLMVIQPSFAEVGWAALWPLGAALAFGLFMLLTRHVSHELDPISLQAVTALMATAVMVPLVLAGDALGLPELALTPVAPLDWGLLVLVGVVGSAAHLLLTWSLRFAPTTTLAPMQYLEIPVAVLIGWLVFDALPNGLAAAGIVVTIAAGLYVIHRERVAAR